MALTTMTYGSQPLESAKIWINEDIAGSPPLELPSYLKDRIESRKRKMWENKTANISMAEAKRKAIINGRVRRLSDQVDHVKKTVQENSEQKKVQAEQTFKRMKSRLRNAECKRSRRLKSISVRCKQEVADAKQKRLENIQKQEKEQEERLEAIKEKLAAGIARRKTELRNKQLRSLAACRWCAARRIQLWWHTMVLKMRIQDFLRTCPKELLGRREPATYYDLRRILISRNNIRASKALLDAIYRFNKTWSCKAGPRILLTCFMIKYFPRSVLAYNGEIEQELIRKGEELALKFRHLVQSPTEHYRMMYQHVLRFGGCWSEYVEALNTWKSVDIERLIGELHRYWEQLQEVKTAMTARADKASTTTHLGAEEDVSDSKAVLAHVAEQEQMIIDRLRQTGGEIAVKELKDKYGVQDQELGEPSSSRSVAEEEQTEQKDEVKKEEHVCTGDARDCHNESRDCHCTEKSRDQEEKPGPSDEFYDSMAKMEMAHEIVMNSDYKIEKQQAEGTHGKVEETMKAAFWDILREDVKKGDFSHCVTLMAEIRTQIESIGTVEKLPPTHPFRVLIADTLDIELIKQQIEHQTFDLKLKVEGIVNILLKLCSEAKDSEVRAVLQHEDVVEIFKSLYAVVDAIKLEIANFYLEQAKSTIKQHSIDYERAKFQEFLDTHPSGLDRTREWIAANKAGSPLSTMCEAYLQLLSVSPPSPESAALDSARYANLGSQLRTLLLTSSLALKLSTLHPGFAEEAFHASLYQTITILAPGDIAVDRDLILYKVIDMCCKKVTGITSSAVESLVADTLTGVITESDTDPVLKLLRGRVQGYLTEVSLNRKPGVPAGFEVVQEEVVKCGATYLKLVDFNRRVYGPFYAQIIKELNS